MKAPKEIRTYCPRCKNHTVHSVSLYKKGKERAMAAGARRHEREKHGYGGQKWPELKRTAKTTKKQLLKLTCKTCDYKIYRLGLRLRKLEVAT
jgi:large subunit ribosomal protein L44e